MPKDSAGRKRGREPEPSSAGQHRGQTREQGGSWGCSWRLGDEPGLPRPILIPMFCEEAAGLRLRRRKVRRPWGRARLLGLHFVARAVVAGLLCPPPVTAAPALSPLVPARGSPAAVTPVCVPPAAVPVVLRGPCDTSGSRPHVGLGAGLAQGTNPEIKITPQRKVIFKLDHSCHAVWPWSRANASRGP